MTHVTADVVSARTENGDTVTAFLHDIGAGSGGGVGRLVVECYGEAWSAYWNAMGGGYTVATFVCSAGSEYVTNCLVRGRRRTTKAAEVRVRKMVEAVLAELKNRMLDRNTPEPTPDVCRWTRDGGSEFVTACGAAGHQPDWEADYPKHPRFCPACGKRVVVEGEA